MRIPPCYTNSFVPIILYNISENACLQGHFHVIFNINAFFEGKTKRRNAAKQKFHFCSFKYYNIKKRLSRELKKVFLSRKEFFQKMLTNFKRCDRIRNMRNGKDAAKPFALSLPFLLLSNFFQRSDRNEKHT